MHHDGKRRAYLQQLQCRVISRKDLKDLDACHLETKVKKFPFPVILSVPLRFRPETQDAQITAWRQR